MTVTSGDPKAAALKEIADIAFEEMEGCDQL